MPDREVIFGAGLGAWNGADTATAAESVQLVTQADRDGLDLFSVADHPYFGAKLDAYALVSFLLGQIERIAGIVTVTNLPSRPAPVLARTITSLSTLSGSDWLSPLYRESRPRIDAAAAAAGRDPAQVATVYNFGGRITPEPLAATRGEHGRWIGGSVQQWIDELTTAVLEHHASGFIYRSTDDTPAAGALARWATEIVPAVRDAIAS